MCDHGLSWGYVDSVLEFGDGTNGVKIAVFLKLNP